MMHGQTNIRSDLYQLGIEKFVLGYDKCFRFDEDLVETVGRL
jgi:hypothetical protein